VSHERSPASATSRVHAWLFVLAGGLVAGTLDILYACVFWGLKRDVPARRIFQSVAAGVLGKATFDGGLRTAALGLALHFFIALSMAAAYYVVARRWPLLWRQPWLCGAVYGVFLYVVMNYVVVPLSRAGAGSKDVLWVTLSVLVHMVLVGIPCALFARRAVAALPPPPAGSSA
jgi:uncharacterized membrane protein YagU involved in acid resistance